MTSVDRQTIRILHVVGGLNRGGVETWLMHVLRHIDRDRFQLVLVTGSSAIACFWLIPTQGVLGAAIALIVGAVVQASFSWGVIVYALRKLDIRNS